MSSKCRPLNSAGRFRVTIHRTRSAQSRLQQSRFSTFLILTVLRKSVVSLSNTGESPEIPKSTNKEDSIRT
jgi:hypothetical protein